MTNSITLTLVHTRGVRFLSDLDKLNSTPDLREKVASILKKRFNNDFACCPPHIYYLISSIIGIILLVAAIFLIKFVEGFIGFVFIGPGVLGIISPCFYTCWHDKRSSNIFYEVMTTIDSETFGIHKMTGSYQVNKYINTLTLSTNVERLKRIKGIDGAPAKKPNKPKLPPAPAKKKPESPKKQKAGSNKVILADTRPKTDQPYNPLQPQGNNRLTIDSVPNMHANRFSNPQMAPFPMYGPSQQFPNQPMQGQFQPFAGPFYGPAPNPNSPFNPNVNMNQGGMGDDLVIHEVNVGGNNNRMTYGNDLYTVPSNVVDDHSEKKK